MQLKRDTEYALRILYAVAERSAPEDEPSRGGATLNEISALSGVPRAGTDRVCPLLASAGFLTSRTENGGDVLYAAAEDLSDRSLIDLAAVTEQGFPLFAVFDRDSAFFSRNGRRLARLQRRAEKLFGGESLGKYLP